MINVFRRVILLDISAAQHRNTVAHAHSLCLVVRYKDGCYAKRGGKLGQLVSHFLTKKSVKCGERLVEQYASRLYRYSSRKGYTLLLTARELMRISLFKVLEVNGTKRVMHPLL